MTPRETLIELLLDRLDNAYEMAVAGKPSRSDLKGTIEHLSGIGDCIKAVSGEPVPGSD